MHGVQPTFHNTRLFLHFPNELCYGYFRFEGNRKIPMGRQENFCRVDCLSFVLLNLRQPYLNTWKMQRKTWYSICGMDAMPLSLKNLLLKYIFNLILVNELKTVPFYVHVRIIRLFFLLLFQLLFGAFTKCPQQERGLAQHF